MHTMREHFGQDGIYWGERGDWLVFMTRTRNSDVLEHANWEAAQASLPTSEGDGWYIERVSHWACGWVEYLIINPTAKACLRVAAGILDRLVDYPVISDETYAKVEHEAALGVWQNGFDRDDRVAYIRKFRSQFDFYDMRDLLANVRGETFGGYAGELLA